MFIARHHNTELAFVLHAEQFCPATAFSHAQVYVMTLEITSPVSSHCRMCIGLALRANAEPLWAHTGIFVRVFKNKVWQAGAPVGWFQGLP